MITAEMELEANAGACVLGGRHDERNDLAVDHWKVRPASINNASTKMMLLDEGETFLYRAGTVRTPDPPRVVLSIEGELI